LKKDLVVIVFSLWTASTCLAQTKSIENRLNEGIVLWESEQYTEAIKKFDLVLSEKPSLYEAYFYRASSKRFLNDKKGALTDYNILVELNPENIEARFKRGMVLYESGRNKEARDEFQYILNNPGGQTNTVFFQRSVHGGGVNGVKTMQSNNQADLYNYISLTYRGENNLSSAIKSVDQAISLDSTNADYYVNKAMLLQETGDFVRATRLYNKALGLNPAHRVAIYNKSVLEGKNKSETDQLKLLNTSIEKDPESPYGYRQRGYYFLKNGDESNAILDFSKAIEIDKNDAETYLNRAIAYTKIGSWNDAMNDYDKAESFAPDWDKVYFNRGNLLYRLRKYSEAINDYSIALLNNPDYALALYQRAIAYQAIGKTALACEDLNKAMDAGVTEAKHANSKICVNK